MKKKLYLLSSLLLTFAFSPATFALNASTSTVTGHTGVFKGLHSQNPVTGTTSSSSENWSGYAAVGNNGSYNSVSSSWTQPSLNCAAVTGNAYSAYWVGLDGFSSPTVEQIGTEADCINNQARYSAWYEMYPSNPYEISLGLSVRPGNQLAASVTYSPPTTRYITVYHRQERITTSLASYQLTLTNMSTGQTFRTNIYTSRNFERSSAEVITEAPYSGGILPLADFGTVNYLSSKANNVALGSALNLLNIVMDNPSGMVATPSAFDPTNQNFSVIWSK